MEDCIKVQMQSRGAINDNQQRKSEPRQDEKWILFSVFHC